MIDLNHTRNLAARPCAVFFVAVLMLGVLLAASGPAQTFTTIYSYTNGSGGAASPNNGVILSGNTLYGTSSAGGSSGYGTVFAVNTDGTGFTVLHTFTGSDGRLPYSGLILSGNTLYGTTASGGSWTNGGTAFAVNTDGSGFRTLHSFTHPDRNGYNSDGAAPSAGLILSSNTLYGDANSGGSLGFGTLFAVSTDGTGFTVLHTFNGSDGWGPYAALILSSNTLYGTTVSGGSSLSQDGTVFSLSIDGTGFRTLHSFTDLSDSYPYGNSDGNVPLCSLILSGNTLYGTAYEGGSSGDGTVFAVSTDGTVFRTVHSFTEGSEGGFPYAGLILSSNTLYGTATSGGNRTNGTVFAVNTDGTGYTTFHNFTGGSDGTEPEAGLILSGNTLYGTARNVFSLLLGPVPVVATTAASNIGLSSATLNGTVNPNGSATFVYFQFGTNTLYGNSTPIQSVGNGGSPVVFSANITGLASNVIYHYQAVAIGAGVTTFGADTSFSALSAGAGAVGVVAEIDGDATVTHTNNTVSTLKRGDSIMFGDTVVTSVGAQVAIQFIDNSTFTVYQNAKLQIDEYIFDPNSNAGTSNFSFLRGSFVWVSGRMGHNNPDGVHIHTPAGSIGIRGTQFISRQDPCSSTQEVYLIQGELAITPLATPGVTNICDAPVSIFVTASNVTTNALDQATYDSISNQLFQATGTVTFGAWLEQYFGCTNNPDAAPNADPDGDGQDNYAEFLAGTDPTSSASCFHILSAKTSGNDLRVSWTCGGGRTNVLQAASSLGGSWSNVSPNIVLAGSGDSVTNYLDVGAVTNTPARFYRVRLLP